MKKLSKTQCAKYQIITVGIILIILKLFKTFSFNWIVTLSPFLLLIAIRLMLFVWGYVMYRINKRSND